MIKMADLIKKQNDMIRKETGMKLTEKLKKEGGPGSGRHADDEDNPFDKEPSDDDLAAIEKEFEGVVKEGPSYEYAPLMKKIEKAENIQAKEVNNFVKLLQKKGLKKEATLLASKYMKNMREFDSFLTKLYRKLV